MNKNPLASVGDADLILDPGRLHMPLSNEACASQALSLSATKSWTQLSDFHVTLYLHRCNLNFPRYCQPMAIDMISFITNF